ncbi:hypothetical protein [Actinoplanes sp. NPDC049118]|uniref:hypothetical protein n=1 Tax=Actinoplanes sp. NPDC049118 TaxID=3155769 RepID=UPI0033D7ED49
MAALLIAPQAANAASKDYTKSRRCGSYEFHSSKTYAYSKKNDGGTCAGHAWVRAKDNLGRISDWRHHANFTSVPSPGGSAYYVTTWHKSQENEDAWVWNP